MEDVLNTLSNLYAITLNHCGPVSIFTMCMHFMSSVKSKIVN